VPPPVIEIEEIALGHLDSRAKNTKELYPCQTDIVYSYQIQKGEELL